MQGGSKLILSSDELALQAAEQKRAELQARRSAVRAPFPHMHVLFYGQGYPLPAPRVVVQTVVPSTCQHPSLLCCITCTTSFVVAA